jgi:CheY-like chemotaxis protein
MSVNGNTAAARSPAVLVVENEEDVRLMLCRMFEGLGAEAVCVSGCADAMQALKSRPFDAAVVDLGMSPIDGRTCGGYIHTLYPSLLLIAYTAYEEAAEGAARLSEYGFSHYFCKGRDEAKLRARVAALARVTPPVPRGAEREK